jgi:hypothetical protein
MEMWVRSKGQAIESQVGHQQHCGRYHRMVVVNTSGRGAETGGDAPMNKMPKLGKTDRLSFSHHEGCGRRRSNHQKTNYEFNDL